MLIVTVLNTQPENAADLILMVAFGIVTSASAVQPENALVPILTTLAGNVTVATVSDYCHTAFKADIRKCRAA